MRTSKQANIIFFPAGIVKQNLPKKPCLHRPVKQHFHYSLGLIP